jgi:hypothetical protein
MNYEPNGTFMEDKIIKILQENLFNDLQTGPYCKCCSGDFKHQFPRLSNFDQPPQSVTVLSYSWSFNCAAWSVLSYHVCSNRPRNVGLKSYVCPVTEYVSVVILRGIGLVVCAVFLRPTVDVLSTEYNCKVVCGHAGNMPLTCG